MLTKVYPAVKALIQKEDKFLLIRQKLPERDIWDLPGGKVKYGESPFESLYREVKEEVNIKISITRIIGLFWFFGYKKEQVICTTFLCSTEEDIVDFGNNPSRNEKIIDYKWVTKDELRTKDLNLSHESLKELFLSL